MYCPNCGNKLNGNETFCSNCGSKVVVKEDQNGVILSETISKKNSNFFKLIIQNVKKFIIKHQKKSAAILSCIVVLIVSVILFNNFYGFDKLSWNEEYSDYKLDYIAPTNIKLGINFENEDKVAEIKYEVTCGEVKNDGLEIHWNFTAATGK